MVRSIDLILFASRHGIILRTDLAKQAIQSIDREALEDAERSHWKAVPWDGTGDPPIGTADRWSHENDAIGKATKEAHATGKTVYFLMRDGKLHHYQPFRAYDQGHVKIEKDDENHPHHWTKASQDHISVEVENAVDKQVLHIALEKAMELHEEAGIPVVNSPAPNGVR